MHIPLLGRTLCHEVNRNSISRVGGTLLMNHCGLQQRQIEAEAMDAPARILSLPKGVVQQKFVRSFFHDWQADPVSRGAYSYVHAGGFPRRKNSPNL